jgi:hypothetical protein
MLHWIQKISSLSYNHARTHACMTWPISRADVRSKKLIKLNGGALPNAKTVAAYASYNAVKGAANYGHRLLRALAIATVEHRCLFVGIICKYDIQYLRLTSAHPVSW